MEEIKANLNSSASQPCLFSLSPDESPIDGESKAEEPPQPPSSDVSPLDYLLEIMAEKHGIHVELQDALDLEDFFTEYTPEELAAYDGELLRAVRSQDIETLRMFHNSGRPLKCSNTFGESILHLACRRNFTEVVRFLVHEARVTVRIRDDFGRTILHDAAWTCEPNFELIELVVRECPDLLYMSDRRGHTPTAYARQSHWGAWNKFLEEHVDLLAPTTICK